MFKTSFSVFISQVGKCCSTDTSFFKLAKESTELVDAMYLFGYYTSLHDCTYLFYHGAFEAEALTPNILIFLVLLHIEYIEYTWLHLTHSTAVAYCASVFLIKSRSSLATHCNPENTLLLYCK